MFLYMFRQLSRRKPNVPRTTGASEIINTHGSRLNGQFVLTIKRNHTLCSDYYFEGCSWIGLLYHAFG